MICPQCKLENPARALQCDCGYDFQKRAPGTPLQQVGAQTRGNRSLDGKAISELTAAELRKVIASGVANGVLLAGIVLLVLAFAGGLVLSSFR